MAEASLLTKQEVDQSHSSVQELVKKRVEVPDRYRYQDPPYGAISSSFPSVEIPVIDFSHLTTKAEIQKLHSALSSWGCFQVINHGIEFAIFDQLGEDARKFFHLPMEEKQKYARPADDIEGYGTDIILSESQILDWTDRLYLVTIPKDEQRMQLWPQSPTSFRKTLQQYSAGTEKVIETLLQSAAKALDLAENSFLNQCGERPIMHCRFNLYPPCPRPDQVLGLKPHTDGSMGTVVLLDKEVEGLQLLNENQWYKVQIKPYSLLFNAGDQLEIISNGIYKSPMHRAVTNSEKERISVAMFWAPEIGKEIEPLQGLISEEKPRLFKTVKDYHLTYFKYYQAGKRAIDAVKIHEY